MAANKDSLKKHHFWIVVGLTPLMVLIAFFMVSSGVGAEIEKGNADITKAKNSFQGKENPKSNVLIEKYGELVNQVGAKKNVLWKENWERQIGLHPKPGSDKNEMVQDVSRNLLRWPNSRKFAAFNYTADYKDKLNFGDRIPDDVGQIKEFITEAVYMAEFSNPYLRDIAREPEKRTGMADSVYPTTFNGDWKNVLRYVNNWGNITPTSEQIWLALEDIWVQRDLLAAVKSVNDQIAKFQVVRDPKVPDSPLQRTFRSRLWQVSIKAEPRPTDGRVVLSGSIRNVTDRLQLLGANNTLVLNVWLSKAPNTQPVPFKIGGEFVPGGETIPIKENTDHVLPLGTPVEEIVKVEQVFDRNTVPIRRIDRVALGYRDNQFAAFELKMPNFPSFLKDEENAKAAATTGPSSTQPGRSPGSGPVNNLSPAAIGGSGGSKTVSTGPWEGGGDVASVIDGSRKRYIAVTKQIRRMPVGIVVVVDQAYMQDVLLAYANSPMRFQITQMHWKRFRGTLEAEPSELGGPVAGGFPGSSGVARSSGGSTELQFGGPRSPRPMSPSSPPGPRNTPPGPAFGPSFGPSGTLDNSSGSTLSEGQLTAGLVEMTIYGAITIYEKYVEDAKP